MSNRYASVREPATSSHYPIGGPPKWPETSPFEMRSWIGLASARQRYIVMTNAICNWIGIPKHLNQPSQHLVLHLFKRHVIAALELDTDREVVTPVTAVPL